MIIETKNENALIVGATVTEFGLNLKDPSVFVQMLLKLYSDPIGSVVREIASNCLDANKESGTDQPVVVGLKDNTFFARDFGSGLSPEFMNSSEQGYCTIGYSTKRNTNDQLGFYGFGRLSPLAYTNQYWIKTVYQGVAYEYLIFLDGNSIKQTLLTSTETDEPSGTTITVKLKREYREENNWANAIREQCAYFQGTAISIEGEKQIVEVNSVGDFRTSNIHTDGLHLVLGTVNYPINWNEFDGYEHLKYLNLGVHIGLDEGVFPTPSREALTYNKHTVDLIKSKLDKICHLICDQCDVYLNALSKEKEIIKYKFIGNDIIACLIGNKTMQINYKTYRSICSKLQRDPVVVEEIPEIGYYKGRVYDKFLYAFDRTQGVYCPKWTPLKKEYAKSLGLDPVTLYKGKNDFSGFVQQTATETRSQVGERIWELLFNQYIDLRFTRFDEVGFEKWKKKRKKNGIKQTRTKVTGIEYYRQNMRDSDLCIKDKAEIDLSAYKYIFKADIVTAQKWWRFINDHFKDFIITKDYGYDLETLEHSNTLKRMCTEALKIKVINSIGQSFEQYMLDVIRDANPVMYQFILDTGLNKQHYIQYTDTYKALVEAGEKLNCFDKDEVKLRYIEHHLKYLKLITKLRPEYSYRLYRTDFSIEDKDLIKRFYVLQRWAEHKEKGGQSFPDTQVEVEVESEPESQLQVELN